MSAVSGPSYSAARNTPIKIATATPTSAIARYVSPLERSVAPLAASAPAPTNPNQAMALSVSRAMSAAMAPTSHNAVAIHKNSW